MSDSKNTPSASVAYSKQYAEVTTATCLEWKPLLSNDGMKDIITDSLSFLQMNQRAHIYAFVIMDNHFHLLTVFIVNGNRWNIHASLSSL